MRVIAFKRRAVSFLWSVRKGTNPAWRIGSQCAVLPFQASRNTDADAYHSLCRQFMDKYGTDWSKTRGFDEDALTYAEYCALSDAIDALNVKRGVSKRRIGR